MIRVVDLGTDANWPPAQDNNQDPGQFWKKPKLKAFVGLFRRLTKHDQKPSNQDPVHSKNPHGFTESPSLPSQKSAFTSDTESTTSKHDEPQPSQDDEHTQDEQDDHRLAHRLSRGKYHSAGGLSINLSLLEQHLDQYHSVKSPVIDTDLARLQAENSLNGTQDPLSTSFDAFWQQSTVLTLDDPRQSEQWSRPSVLSASAQETAHQLWQGTHPFIVTEQVAEWLGQTEHKETLVCYMDQLSLADLPLEEAFRLLCSKLYFKAEAQQIDRILVAFAHRFWDCNPQCVFRSPDMVHTMVYSILLLNTDLHAAQGNHQRMTRQEFLDNTIPAIQSQIQKQHTVTYPSKFIPTMEIYLKNVYTSIKQHQVLQPGQAPQGGLKRGNSVKRGMQSLIRRQKEPTPPLSMPFLNDNVSTSTLGSSSTITSASPTIDTRRPCTRSLSLRQATANKTITRNYALNRSNSSSQRAPFYRHASVSTTGEFLMDVPFAKEAIVWCKHLLHATNVKARSRHWTKYIMVVDQDNLRLYQFTPIPDPNTDDKPQIRGPLSHFDPSWSDRLMLCLPLNHALANLVPPPGYSKARPHVFALQLPGGGVYLFQGSSQEDALSWVTTCNFWAARISKPPLQGGVTNMEYGWGDCLKDVVLDLDAFNDGQEQPGLLIEEDHLGNDPDQTFGLSADQTMLYEWQPPTASMATSELDEPDQLTLLKSYLQQLDQDANEHRDTKSKMMIKFAKDPDLHKRAMVNWENRSSFLLGEIIKYQHYCDALEASTQTTTSSTHILDIPIDNQQLDMIQEIDTVLSS
ncbi:hypothetical protein DM01DRAFT_1384793 [Hesseltinella vesiculosa]|uniref:SEC7 domain-containing protein n=1 Tax=Hesseltinella vesiculosa TaxID=101127 RepID=A0A1X2GCE6_9FUNG|nr:hypothetical protein DM01DRAFT_1384793 [Hesseltinella vesiculosa]